jgi:acetate kinase
MRALVLNCGSSSVKFRVHAAGEDGKQALARGAVERLGEGATLAFEARGLSPRRESAAVRDHAVAVARVVAWLAEPATREAVGSVDVVGHRVVHGGARFDESVLIDDAVVRGIEQVAELAPLHNRPSLAGIRAARAAFGPRVPMVAVFDTSFHARLPERAWRYAIPDALARKHGIRRFGFHGTSYRWTVRRYAELTGRAPEGARLVALHLGAGCSAAAIAGGASVDTSMGLTPLEGLVMGTRSGDLDPYLVAYLAHAERLTVDDVERLLNERSGLLGVSGSSGDMRDLARQAARGDARAAAAIDLFCYRARKYLGAYLAALGGADAVVFTGGIGEHAPAVRAGVCEGMGFLGLVLDPSRNAAAVGVEARISADGAHLPAYVIPADEERMIALDCFTLLRGDLT